MKKSLFASIFMILPFVFVCFGLSPAVRAVVPAPDGGYPGFNTAEGTNALFSLTSGVGNNAIGFQALLHNTTGIHNTADGFAAMSRTTTGQHNTATGDEALGSNTTGSFNTADGGHALENNTGTGNTANVFNRTSAVGAAVFVNSSGKLGTITSSRRFKEEIEPMAQASEGLFALKPVTFRYKKGIDPQRIPQFGLVAEDVEAVNPDLVVRDEEGKVNTVRYDAVNAMLLNEFLKEHRKVEELSSIVAEQRKEVNALAAAVKEQAAQVQKVSAQVELSKAQPQMVVNKQ